MADAVVSFLVVKLGDQLIQEASLLYGVTNQVRWLERELKQLQVFLRETDPKGGDSSDEGVKEWVKELRDVAYQAEDVVDDYILKNDRRRRRTRLERIILFFNDLISRYKFGKEIEGVKAGLSDIFNRRDRYGINPRVGEPAAAALTEALEERKRRSKRPEPEDLVVGFDDSARQVVQRLTTLGGEELVIVTIVGMGGLGKTTLAKKVYNSTEVQMWFDLFAWVYVSKGCPVEKLLRELIRKVIGGEVEGGLEREAMENKLNEHLKGKRFLIAMDDVWEDGLLERLVGKRWGGSGGGGAFRDAKSGSRILVTTRSSDVANYAEAAGGPRPFQLPLLNDDESFELFNRKVFGTVTCPQEELDLERLGRQLVRMCKGLPLAIVVLGGLLSRKPKTVMAWDRMYETTDWRFDPNTQDCQQILALSYREMPDYLKPCFLYFGLFPEDTEIRSSKLKMLWIAEGFVEDKGKTKKKVEDMAEYYLEELFQRSLIQVASKKSYGGTRTCGIKSCRIHDLLRDLAITAADELKFLGLQNDACRRLAIQRGGGRHDDDDDDDDNVVSLLHTKLRSLLCFNFNQAPLNLIPLVQSLKLLRVVDLNDVAVGTLPQEIGRLIHLRFLGLNNTNLKSLPSSLGDLFNLQTLDIRSNGKLSVPTSVWTKLQNLRYFYLDWHAPSRIDGLPNIQILNGILAGDWIANSLADKLKSVNRLAIRNISSSHHQSALANALPYLKDLHYLALIGKGSDPIPQALPLANLSGLYLLCLYGRLEQGIISGSFPPALTKLTLRASKLDQDPLAALSNLPSLESLKLLKDSYIGTRMVCPASGFPKLKFLTLDHLDEVEEWELEDRAMTGLKRLVISNCPKLKMLPEGLSQAAALQELELAGMPDEFKARVRREGGEDRHKIQRIPSITLNLR